MEADSGRKDVCNVPVLYTKRALESTLEDTDTLPDQSNHPRIKIKPYKEKWYQVLKHSEQILDS
jgi:hypothetical protein